MIPRALLAAFTALALASANNTPTDTCITSDGSGLLLAAGNHRTVLVTSPTSLSSTHRLALSLASDIRKTVPSSTVDVLNSTSLSSLGAKPEGETWILLGALDESPLVNEAVNATGIDVSNTRGQWEAWTIGKGVAGGSEVVVVAGADRVSLAA
jgi:hypothetical protein